jgi:predicted ester cyclase
VGNVDRIERLFEGVWNGTDPAVADELVHPEYLIHDRELAERLRGPELYRALAEGTREAVPDAEFAIADAFGVGDRVAVRWTMTGTHEGDLHGVEPTGRSVTLTGVEIDRFEGGRLVETWAETDVLGLLEQVGGLSGAGDGDQP